MKEYDEIARLSMNAWTGRVVTIGETLQYFFSNLQTHYETCGVFLYQSHTDGFLQMDLSTCMFMLSSLQLTFLSIYFLSLNTAPCVHRIQNKETSRSRIPASYHHHPH